MAKKRRQTREPKNLDPAEVQKRLLMVLLLKIGASTKEVAIALGVTERRVQQMIPVDEIEKLHLGQEKARS